MLGFHLIEGRIYKQITNKRYADSIKRVIETLISKKKLVTLDIAKIIAHDNDIIEIMRNKQYNKLDQEDLFYITRDYRTFKHLGIYIINRKGDYLHIPINKTRLTEKPTGYEEEILKKIASEGLSGKLPPRDLTFKGILVSRNDLVFEGIVPITDYNGRVLGYVEAITHFNSIALELRKDGIESAVIVSKNLARVIKHPLSPFFIKGYYVANLNIAPRIKNILEQVDIDTLIHLKDYKYIVPKGNFFTGYYVVSVPIKCYRNETCGYYLGFAYDRYGLGKREVILRITAILILVVFIATAYLVYRYGKYNAELIETLNDRVKIKTAENLMLIYRDTTTEAYKITKFDRDLKEASRDTYTVMFNIRNFSKINSIYGFNVGDKVLRIVVRRVSNIINGPVYRIHADEFVFITKHYERDITAIRKNFIEDPIDLHEIDVKLRLSFSFGVCKNDKDDVLSKVSIATKEARTTPYKEYVLYQEKHVDRSFIKYNAILYDALFKQEKACIVPYFQGIMDNRTKSMTKYEVLTRIIVGREVYTPFFFLEVAKSSGFIREMTGIVMDKALNYISKLNKTVEISVNITEDDLSSGNLRVRLQQMLEAYHTSPERITLEILEDITSRGTKNSIEKLKELKQMGVKLAVDDFGVQYSNFERIAELDVDYIKIDGKYIRDIAHNVKYEKITRAITDFAHSAGIEVVAEYVETKEIQEMVESMGIEYSQGYYFSKPTDKI